jgi:phage tail-like protein
MAVRLKSSSRGKAPLMFTIAIDGLPDSVFQEVSGIGIETEVIEFREGGGGGVRKMPGISKYPNLVLKRGYTGSVDLYDWAAARDDTGDVVRRTVSIALTARGREVARWTVHRAWPVKWDAPTLNAKGNDVPMETIELAHDGISRQGLTGRTSS